MADEPLRSNVAPLVVAALVGAVLFGAGVVLAVGVTGDGDMTSMMGDGMMGDMDHTHKECHAMMEQHHGNETAAP